MLSRCPIHTLLMNLPVWVVPRYLWLELLRGENSIGKTWFPDCLFPVEPEGSELKTT